MTDKYDFCGLERGECAYQINADEKIETLEKALVIACTEIVMLRICNTKPEEYVSETVEDVVNEMIKRAEEDKE